jgi:hypothetical protein
MSRKINFVSFGVKTSVATLMVLTLIRALAVMGLMDCEVFWLLHGVLEKGNKCTAVSGSGEQVTDNLQNSSLYRKCGDCHLLVVHLIS